MTIQVIPTDIPDLLIIQPKVYGDERGWFYESFNDLDFSKAIGHNISFVQDNHSFSKKGVLRGLHYQVEKTQGKLVRVCRGSVLDVAVDLRQSSPTLGRWVGVELSSENKNQLWIPPGFAHGFVVLSDEVEFLYKTTDYWHAQSEYCIVWNDPHLNIQWPKHMSISVSDKDSKGLNWDKAPKL